MRHKGILLVVMAMLLATAGIVYAHWTATLHVDGNVNTGGVGIAWQGVWTNDDGVDNADGEAPGLWPEAWDNWDSASSADPADPFGVTRYDKDVAGCWADGGGDHLSFQIENGYPSYHCALNATIFNEGSVPLKATAFGVETGYWECYVLLGGTQYGHHGDESGFEWLEYWSEGNPGDEFNLGLGDIALYYVGDDMYADVSEDGPTGDDPLVVDTCDYNDNDGLQLLPGVNEGNFALGHEGILELTGDIALGMRCGTQIDPGEQAGAGGWVHVEQEAWQNYGYHWTLDQSFVNWNEFSYCLCNDGAVAADADGDEIGMVNLALPDQDCLVLP